MKGERRWRLLRFTLFSLGSLAVLPAIVGATYETVSSEWLERAYTDRDDSLVELKGHPALDGLRADLRYTDLLRRVGLPQ